MRTAENQQPLVSNTRSAFWRDGWYVVPHDVIFRDIDAFGHVNNAVFLTYFEIARTLLWFEISGSRQIEDVGFIVVRAECDFKKQLSLERIEICVRIGEIRTSSFDTHYEIRKNGGHEVAAIGSVVAVLFDWTQQSKKSIDDQLRRRLEECSRVAF